MKPDSSASKPQAKPKPQSPTHPVIQMQPRRGLFFALLTIFVVWVGILVTMYVTTVYHKHDVHLGAPASR